MSGLRTRRDLVVCQTESNFQIFAVLCYRAFACYNLIILALKYRKPIYIRKHFNSFFGVNLHAEVSATPLVFLFLHGEMPSGKEVKLTTVPFS